MENCNIELCGEVAERRLAEQHLHERERRYRDIFHNISDCVYLLEVTGDGRFRYLETNRAFEMLMGVPEDGMLGKYIGDTARASGAEATADRVIAKFRHCLDTASVIDEEIMLDLPSGQRIFQSTLTPLFDNNGRIDRILGISRNITERKQAEQQIGFMNFALDQLHEAVFLVDPQSGFRFRYVNDRACQLLGYTREELLGMCVPDINPYVDLTAIQTMDEQQRKQLLDRFETFHRAKDGHIFPVEISSTELEYEGQTMNLSIVRDITERKRMEAEVQNHLRFFESMDRVNRAIQGSSDLETVLNNVLDAVLAIFDCDRTYFSYPCDPEADSWSVPLERCRPEYPGARSLGGSISMDEGKAKALSILLESDGPVTFGPGNQYPLPADVSAQFGFKSYMAMSIYPKGDEPWAFGIQQCSRARGWTADEIKLFQEIGRRLTDGLTSLLAYRDIQEREQKFRTLAENLPDHIARYDRQARKTYANQKLRQLLGGDEDDAAWMEKKTRENFPDGEVDEYQAKLEDVIRTGKSEELELTTPDGDGGWRYCHVRFIAERGADGEIAGVLAIGRDVTRKRQLELELIRNEREFRMLAENSPGFIGRYDPDLRRTYVNRYYEEATKTVSGEVLGKTPLQYWRLTVPSAEEFCRILQRVMATRQQEQIEAHAVTASGMLRYFSMHMVPEFAENGEVTGVLTVGVEITDIKNAEQRRLEAREDERKLLARELHDDLGQRLTALRMDIYLLGMLFGADNQDLLVKIREMDSAVGGTIQIVRNLLSMLRPAVLDLGLAAALEWLADEFRKRTDIECGLQLPRQDIALDETQSMAIFRIAQESLTNIAKHAQANQVQIALAQDNSGYLLEIRDDGKGFDLSASKKKGSFGLQGIEERVQMLGGELAVETAPGCGVKLTVRISSIAPLQR